MSCYITRFFKHLPQHKSSNHFILPLSAVQLLKLRARFLWRVSVSRHEQKPNTLWAYGRLNDHHLWWRTNLVLVVGCTCCWVRRATFMCVGFELILPIPCFLNNTCPWPVYFMFESNPAINYIAFGWPKLLPSQKCLLGNLDEATKTTVPLISFWVWMTKSVFFYQNVCQER